jgi:hypothetical protein
MAGRRINGSEMFTIESSGGTVWRHQPGVDAPPSDGLVELGLDSAPPGGAPGGGAAGTTVTAAVG